MNMRERQPTVSIIIIAYNEETTIKAVIGSAVQQDYPNIFEIIVIDGNSRDQTQRIAQEYSHRDSHVRFIIEDANRRHRGPAAARRLGIEASKGEYVLFLNGDVTVAPYYVSSLLKFAQENNLVGAAGLRWNKDATLIEDFVNIRYWLSYFVNENEISHPRFLSSDAVLYLRKILIEIGNLDPSLISEDIDIGYRLIAYNQNIRYLPQLLIYHKGRHYQTFRRYLQQRLWYGKGLAQLAEKYPFRFVAEQNKVNNFIIRPLCYMAIWFVLTFVTILFFWPLSLIVQFWVLSGIGKLMLGCWATYRKFASAATPTHIRPVCCLFWPIFDWLSYISVTLSYIRHIKPPDVLCRNWLNGPMFSSVVKAVNLGFSNNRNTYSIEKDDKIQ